MAKKYNIPKHTVGKIITTKSAFGSHSEMIVSCEDPHIQILKIDDDQVICKDDTGYYITNKNRIDSGLADPNRYASQKARFFPKELDKEIPKE
jgi:hypothetical protein